MNNFLSNTDLLLAFVPVFASVLALPGPNAAFAVGQSLKYGVVRSLFVPLGFMLATGIHAAMVLSGLGVLVLQYTSALEVLKWLGVLYLLYLAYKAFTAKSSVSRRLSKADVPARHADDCDAGVPDEPQGFARQSYALPAVYP